MQRNRDRSRYRGASLLAQATAYLNGIAPYYYWDFINNRALFASADVGPVTSTPGWAFTRPIEGYYPNLDGTLATFAPGEPRIGARGILIEGARTNLCLWSNDQTNAAWVKTNVTAALNQTGPDGVANGACSLTATAGNGTVLQSIISGSANRYGSIWIKRITGSGNIDITLDGGTAWTTIAVTTTWQQLGKAQTAVTNPNFGLRIVTSGDAVAVKFGQVESADFPTSPITTTTIAVARSPDVATVTGLSALTLFSDFVEFSTTSDTSGSFTRVLGSTGSIPIFFNAMTEVRTQNGAVTLAKTGLSSFAAGRTVKAAVSIAAARRALTADGAAVATDAQTWTMPTSLQFGNDAGASSFLHGFIRRAAIIDSTVSDASLQAMTV